MSGLLPEQFADLERFSQWVLPGSGARNLKRINSSMAELREFYNAMIQRIEAIIEYLNQYSPDEMPQDAQRLLRLALSLAEVSNAVELFGEPRISGGFDPTRFVVTGELDP